LNKCLPDAVWELIRSPTTMTITETLKKTVDDL